MQNGRVDAGSPSSSNYRNAEVAKQQYMVRCASCGRSVEPRLTCPQCEAPLGAELDLFAALNLPRKLAVDNDALERVYHEAGRRVHPDRYANAASAVRQASLRST